MRDLEEAIRSRLQGDSWIGLELGVSQKAPASKRKSLFPSTQGSARLSIRPMVRRSREWKSEEVK